MIKNSIKLNKPLINLFQRSKSSSNNESICKLSLSTRLANQFDQFKMNGSLNNLTNSINQAIDNQSTANSKMKYILITGGVISGIGKGILASSIGAVLKASGIKITSIKIDPYINVDAGTFSPYEHGEVFVLDDGGEVDLDLGNFSFHFTIFI